MRTPVPKYFTSKAVLGARLDRECLPDERLPSESALCREFGVSRIRLKDWRGGGDASDTTERSPS